MKLPCPHKFLIAQPTTWAQRSDVNSLMDAIQIARWKPSPIFIWGEDEGTRSPTLLCNLTFGRWERDENDLKESKVFRFFQLAGRCQLPKCRNLWSVSHTCWWLDSQGTALISSKWSGIHMSQGKKIIGLRVQSIWSVHV